MSNTSFATNLPAATFDAVVKRAATFTRSPSAEITLLLDQALAEAGANDIALDGVDTSIHRRICLWVSTDTLRQVKARSRRYGRSVRVEMLVLLAFMLKQLSDQPSP